MHRFTHIGRHFDFRLASNRWAAGLTAAGAVAGLFIVGDRSPAAAAFQTALTVFLTWALVRELDPDRPLTAGLAAALAGAATLWTGETNLVALAGLMLAARIVVRTTGRIPLLTDLVAVGLLVGVFARDPFSWMAGLTVAAAVALDASLPDPAPARHVWLAAAIAVAVTLTVVLSDALPSSWSTPNGLTLVLAAGGVLAGLGARTLPLVSTTDHGKNLIVPLRLRAARGMATAATLLATLIGGAAVAETTWPAWIGVISVGAVSRSGTS